MFAGHKVVASLIRQKIREEGGDVGRRWEVNRTVQRAGTGFAFCCLSDSKGAVPSGYLSPGREMGKGTITGKVQSLKGRQRVTTGLWGEAGR